jgi:hypothetical protein
MTDLQHCPVCGASTTDDDRFCPNCGAQLGTALVPLTAVERIEPPGGTQRWPASNPLLSLEIDFPERLSRWKIFVKWIFAIPHLIVLSFFSMLVSIIVWIAWFVILFTKRYPEELYKLVLMYMRWTANVNAYVLLQRDEYPPFGEGPYPVHLELPYPVELSRWLIFIKWLLVIPVVFVYAFVGIAMGVGVFIAWWCILLTARMPKGLFDFITGVNRWGYRINAYSWLMTDKYPPFSLEE